MPERARRIAVLGLGRSGEAVVDWVLSRSAAGEDVSVSVFVEHDSEDLRVAAERLVARGATVALGVSEVPADGFDLVVASPGIAPHRALMVSARALGVPVISEMELAYRVSPAPFVAITGTNGKTTTTALTTHLLLEAGHPAEAVGNYGPPAISAAAEVGRAGVLVAECSSFQLALTERFRPRVSVLLNITPDHLDWHGSLEAYAFDKGRVFANQGAGDTAIIDVDDPGSTVWADTVEARGVRVVRISRERLYAGGAGLVEGVLTVETAACTISLVNADELRIRGAHNVSNALAAAAAALAMGADPEHIREGLRSFEALEHRLEPVATIAGVSYVNDSKGTNPDAVLKALTAFDGRPIVILLGGRGKGGDFRPLARACANACRTAVLYGETRAAMEEAFVAEGVAFETAGGMVDAIGVAGAAARPGDVILLSPACASFDEFKNYEERGREFKRNVARLTEGGR
ncbi:MAG: UDP-N-acetylmuramoyl-L-alanine--D-glutamate ligase [Coriobacteriia bacterium]|nr:UDP-N-acetylmuramoyl-L-alanine--D-glutamate ligase [Coriobacteriia bacterium]